MPDPSFESGVSLQREYLDISNPDNGIFLDRSYKMPGAIMTSIASCATGCLS